MTRLRFKEQDDGTLITKVNSVIRGALLVKINLVTGQWKIKVDVVDGYVISANANPKVTSKSNLIKEVKSELKELGVVFDDEIRNKRRNK